jgi:hypothetical protein
MEAFDATVDTLIERRRATPNQYDDFLTTMERKRIVSYQPLRGWLVGGLPHFALPHESPTLAPF